MKLIKQGLMGLSLMALAFSGLHQKAYAELTNTQGRAGMDSIPGEFVIRTRLRGLSAVDSLQAVLKSLGLSVTRTLNTERDLHLVKLVNAKLAQKVLGQDLTTALIARLNSLSGILYAEPNYVYRAALGAKWPGGGNPIPQNPPPEDSLPEKMPNDTLFGQLWAMKNIGQKDDSGRVGTPRADIRATKAWTLGTGSRKVVVAVVDTGIDYTHPDLKDNVWSLPGQPEVHGYNAINDTLDPMDDNSHGTHCAGTIGGMGDNDDGVVGVNWQVSLMAVKFLDSQGSGSLDAAIKAIDWAVEHGAQILSNSWGGGSYSKALEDSIRRAADKGVLFVAAAGNGGFDGVGDNNDNTANYPSNYAVENVVAVAASNNVDQMSSFSNYGKKTVHLMAPGEKIHSSVPGGKYATYSGTSMATPHVAGAAALLLSVEPHLTAVQVKERLISSAYRVQGYEDKLVSGGRLDLYSLLAGE